MVSKFFDRAISIANAFTLGLCVFIVVYVSVFFRLGPSVISNGNTVLLGVGLALLMLMTLRFSRRKAAFDWTAVLIFCAFTYMFPRIFQYLAVRQKSLKLLYLLFPKQWTVGDINHGLSYILIGTAAIFIGFFVSEYLFYRKRNELANSDLFPTFPLPSLKSFILSGILIYGVDGYYTIYHGMSASSGCTIPDLPAKWLIHFFSGDIYIYAVMAFLLPQFDKLTRKYKAYLVISIFIYIAYTVLLGSRGGILRVLTTIFCIAIAYGRDVKIKVRHIFTLLPMAVVISISLFYLGTTIREYKRANCGETFSAGRHADESTGYEADPRAVGRYEKSPKDSNKFVFPVGITIILDRLGMIDYSIGMLTTAPNPEAKALYLNWTYPARNLINNLVPGVPFPEAQLMTNNMLPILYRGYNLKHVQDNFLSEPYTIWGLAYVYFGRAGGLFFLFFSAALLHTLYLFGSHRLGPWSYFFKGATLWLVGIGAYFFNMGIDHLAVVFAYGFLQLSVTFGSLWGIDQLISRFSRGKNDS